MKLKTHIEIFNALNREVFDNALTRPIFRATRNARCLAQAYTIRDVQYIDLNLSDINGIAHAEAVMYHEMMHLYIDNVLGLWEDDHHGPIFWCHYLGLAPKGIELGSSL